MIQYFEYFGGHFFHCADPESIQFYFRYEFGIAWHGIFLYKSQGPFLNCFQFTDTKTRC